MSNYVLIIDTNKKPCNPVHPGTARQLLKLGQAAVWRKYPFTLILKAESQELTRPIQLKIDPGSKTTGIALVQGDKVVFGAACVGDINSLKVLITKPLLIKATGHGTRQMCGTDKFGFPTRHRTNKQIHFGFQTGDIVKAVVKTGKKVGTYIGRIATRATGSFNITTNQEKIQGISHKYCKSIHKKDGYSYSF